MGLNLTTSVIKTSTLETTEKDEVNYTDIKEVIFDDVIEVIPE